MSAEIASNQQATEADEVVRHDTCPKDLDTNGDNLKTNRDEHRHLSNSLREAQRQEEVLHNEREGFESRQQEQCEQSKQAGVVRSGTHYSDEQSIGHQFVHSRSLPDETNCVGANFKFAQQRFYVVTCILVQRV